MILSQQEGVDLKVFDCTAYPTPEEGDPIMNYKEKHIQGAEHLDLRYLRDMSKPYPFMLPSEKQFVDFMRSRNIKLSSRVIVYDTKPGQTFFATRAYFMFRAFGHKNVSVLNGGLTKWIAEGRPVESDKAAGVDSDYAYKLDTALVNSYDQVKAFEKEISA